MKLWETSTEATVLGSLRPSNNQKLEDVLFSLFPPKTQVFHWQMTCSEDRRNYSEFYQNQSLLTSSFLLEGITIFYFNFTSWSFSCLFSLMPVVSHTGICTDRSSICLLFTSSSSLSVLHLHQPH